jgi:asparagine synthase (glutamine-hydrolysing)
MCGIAGQLRIAPGAPPIDLEELGRVSGALSRRGPDGSGLWLSPDEIAAFAHRRLAILDLTAAAAQPMTSNDGRYTIVYNGEIYDFRSHREALARSGVRFRTASDTELLLELLAREGPRALSRLRGMYAFAMWDGLERELLLVRDPYGIKPLYYSVENGMLRFASQVKALEAGGRISRETDPAAVAGFLAWGAVPEPLTLRRSIRAVPAGHALRASSTNGVTIEPLPFRPTSRDAVTVETAIEESVRDHLVSDVPVAVFLSAGLDSAMIAALARRNLPEPPTALTLTLAESRATRADEEPLARQVAKLLGLRHVVREVDGDLVRGLAAEILQAMDQPSIDGFNTFLIARLAREEGFKVALSGLGGDELLGGYPSFADVGRWQRRARTLRRVPGLKSLWPGLAGFLAPGRPKLRGLLRFGHSAAGAYCLRRGLFLPDDVSPRSVYDPVLDAWESLSSGILGSTQGLLKDPWGTVHRLESSMYLKNQLLRDADWAGMAHGVEIRVPLVDARLRAELEAANFEPARTSGKRELVRRLFREAPAELFTRSKSGFQLPVADWLDPDAPAERPVGQQSRRLARRVLAAFDIDLDVPLN